MPDRLEFLVDNHADRLGNASCLFCDGVNRVIIELLFYTVGNRRQGILYHIAHCPFGEGGNIMDILYQVFDSLLGSAFSISFGSAFGLVFGVVMGLACAAIVVVALVIIASCVLGGVGKLLLNTDTVKS